MGRDKPKVHEATAAVIADLAKGGIRARCGTHVSEADEVVSDLSEIPREDRCLRCWRKHGVTTDYDRVQALRMLVRDAGPDDVVPVEQLRAILRD